ncbi:hypothetical protein R6Q59_001626 [Mikania micrantha]
MGSKRVSRNDVNTAQGCAGEGSNRGHKRITSGVTGYLDLLFFFYNKNKRNGKSQVNPKKIEESMMMIESMTSSNASKSKDVVNVTDIDTKHEENGEKEMIESPTNSQDGSLGDDKYFFEDLDDFVVIKDEESLKED